MKYLPFFEIQLRHTYYTDQRCPDFRMVPSKATQALLTNHRCVLRSQPSGIQVLISVGDDGVPFIPISKESIFLFELHLNNPDFPFFTDLNLFKNLNAPVYTNNKLENPAATELTLYAKREWKTEALLSTQPQKNERFVLGGRPIGGAKPKDFEVTGPGIVQSYDADSGLIGVDTRALSTGKIFTVSYPVLPRLNPGVFAEVEVRNNETLPQEGDAVRQSRLFQISFSAKTARWTYYCVTDFNPSQGSFRIVDTGPVENSRLKFSDRNQQDLDQKPDPGDEVAKGLVAQYPHFRKVRFLSDDPVPCRQAANSYLEFYVGENKLSGSLPNPSFRNNFTLGASEGRSSKQDAVFQVIKYVNS